MNKNKRINYDSRNVDKGMVTSTSSRNEFIEKNISNNDNKNFLKKENNEIKNIIKFIKQKEEEVKTTNSKRSSENILLLENNPQLNKLFDKNKSNILPGFDYNKELKNKYETFNYYSKNFNKNVIEAINFNETENDINIEKENKNNVINKDKKEEIKGISIDEIFNLIMGYNFNKVIEPNYIRRFFFSSVPEEKTLSMNINKINQNKNNESNLSFNYNLEILKNNQIYFFAQIKKTFPSSNIKLYIKSSHNQYNKVGKIISNLLKNDFIVYKGDNKTNYEKILHIIYEINFFGNKMRKMTIEKYENNTIKYTLCNDLPEWDIFYKTYKLNFNGRVKQTSKKNFILKYQNSNENESEKILQCGKINDNCFALDFIAPLSPFEAFSISITSIIYKISCD